MGRMVVGERKVGAFERTIQLPPPGEEEGEAVDGEKMTSKLEDGIMIVTAPKRKAGK
jgi:HSP20 family protein